MFLNFLKFIKKISVKSDTKPVLWGILLIPKKESVTLKLSSFRKNEDNTPFFEYGHIKYFIHNEKITIINGKLTLLYKIGYSEPLDITPTTEEVIFSSELTDALKSKVIKEFRTVENIEIIEEMKKKLDILMVICVVFTVVLLLVYVKLKGIDTFITLELSELKTLVSSIKVI